ncbi:MAG TPA: DUF1116 domain-containing protein [Anaerolineales bacterium]|nr:DUF1116 domain-containing protein [Anaerolineales bacterium]
MDIDRANATAAERMMDSRPILRSVAAAREVIPGMDDDLLLHAGPPISWDRMSGPLRGAIIGALIFEGRAGDEAAAVKLAQSGRIRFEPCHDHDAVGPMAGVISPSMAVYVLEDVTHGRKTFSNLNEGYGKVLRYGAFSDEVLQRLRWMNEILGPTIGQALADGEGLDLRATMAEALHMGDEGHNRNKAGSLLFLRFLAPRVARLPLAEAARAEVLRFIGENALSILNPVMAACKAMTLAGHDVDGSTVVTVMARNGTDFGIRVSGLGDAWFTAPAAVPVGLYFPGFSEADANPDIGDSAITETAGIGGFAMATAPAIVAFVGGTPRDALNATLEMFEITVTEHKIFTMPALDFRGTPTGIDLRKVVELGITPRINTGIAHRQPGVGQVGAGLVRPPMAMFEQALLAFAEKYGI